MNANRKEALCVICGGIVNLENLHPDSLEIPEEDFDTETGEHTWYATHAGCESQGDYELPLEMESLAWIVHRLS